MRTLCVTLALLGAAALIVVGGANSTPRHAASSGYWTPLACKLREGLRPLEPRLGREPVSPPASCASESGDMYASLAQAGG